MDKQNVLEDKMEDNKDYDSKEKENITHQSFNIKKNVKNLKNHKTPKHVKVDLNKWKDTCFRLERFNIIKELVLPRLMCKLLQSK